MLKNTGDTRYEVYWAGTRTFLEVGDTLDVENKLGVDAKDVKDLEKVLMERYPTLKKAETKTSKTDKDDKS